MRDVFAQFEAMEGSLDFTVFTIHYQSSGGKHHVPPIRPIWGMFQYHHWKSGIINEIKKRQQPCEN